MLLAVHALCQPRQQSKEKRCTQPEDDNTFPGGTAAAANHTSPRGPTRWESTDNPQRYGAHFAELLASGADVYGEARLVDVLSPRGANILDAGCGMGRIGGALGHLGHTVVGVDLDAKLLQLTAEHPPDCDE